MKTYTIKLKWLHRYSLAIKNVFNLYSRKQENSELRVLDSSLYTACFLNWGKKGPVIDLHWETCNCQGHKS